MKYLIDKIYFFDNFKNFDDILFDCEFYQDSILDMLFLETILNNII